MYDTVEELRIRNDRPIISHPPLRRQLTVETVSAIFGWLTVILLAIMASMMNTKTQPQIEELSTDINSQDYQVVAQAIEFLSQNVEKQPTLDEIAAHVHLSKYHFQRLFKRWAGITPTQFLHYLTVEYAKARLAESQSIFNASLDVGLSGAGRLHDLFVNIEAMTPGEYKKKGDGLTIYYGFHETPFGKCLLAVTERGICALRFVGEAGDSVYDAECTEEFLISQLRDEWPAASITENSAKTQPLIEQIFTGTSDGATRPLTLLIKGTNFQVNVWKALMAIPSGALVSYQTVAEEIGKPKAVRAVASAVANNPIGYVIPCHRVISKAGNIHKYRWGETRKKAIIGWEARQRL